MPLKPRWLLAVFATLFLAAGGFAGEEPTENALVADSFEEGTSAPREWKQGTNVPGVKYVYDRKSASKGERSLSLQKSANRYFPIAQWIRQVDHTGDKTTLEISAKVKAAKAAKAIIDVQFFDANDKALKHEWAAYIGQKEAGDPLATHDWKTYSGKVEIPAGTKQIGIALQIYGPGQVWFDELEARYVDTGADDKSGDRPAAGNQSSRGDESPQAPPVIEVQTAGGGLSQYLLIPPAKGTEKPQAGHPLLLVLPGGDGSASFQPFIQSMQKEALAGRFVVAQLLAPPQVVWPTKSSVARVGTTEAAIAAVIEDAARKQPVDRQRVYALGWSSSGPALYAALLQEQSPLAGVFIAMSVYRAGELPPLANAVGRRVYLLHSPEDAICPYRMANDAKEQLSSAGVDVTLVNYAGGHGWHGPVWDNIRAGVEWLERPRSR